jgi:hypothetical protein
MIYSTRVETFIKKYPEFYPRQNSNNADLGAWTVPLSNLLNFV